MSTNNIFNSNNIYKGHRYVHSRKENMVSEDILEEFNKYRVWGSFNLAADVDPLTTEDFTDTEYEEYTKNYDAKNRDELYKKTGKSKKGHAIKENKDRGMVKSSGVASIFNKFHAVPLENTKYNIRISENMPLLDSPNTRQLQREMNSCTIKDLVLKSKAGLMGTATYEYSDFMFCKYLGRVPNNRLITLRRYVFPCNDYVRPYGNTKAKQRSDKGQGTVESTYADSGGVPVGCMLTWLDTPGNEMSEILKYNFNMPFKSVDSKWEDVQSTGDTPPSNTAHGAVGKVFATATQSSVFNRIANMVKPGAFNYRGGRSISHPGPHYDPNKAYAGVDMIKSIYIRDPDAGLKFNHSFKLQFDYELKSYDGINGKQAMLDLLGNILSVCYTTGDFWPGAYRHTGGSSTMQPLSSLECMKHHKTFSGYVRAFQTDFNNIKQRINSSLKKINSLQDAISALLGVLDNIGGQLLGGDSEMDSFTPTQMSGVNSLLGDNAVGLWHVTIGNPCAPIMSIGNLVMKNCEIQHYGPLGIDDFPTGLRVTCEFDHGKPRDKRLIERMYNSGEDRIYVPLDTTIMQVLARSYECKNQESRESAEKINNVTDTTSAETKQAVTDVAKETGVVKKDQQAIGPGTVSQLFTSSKSLKSLRTVALRFFGSDSPTGILWTACEQAEGAPANAHINEQFFSGEGKSANLLNDLTPEEYNETYYDSSARAKKQDELNKTIKG